jgi:hypothetical protein
MMERERVGWCLGRRSGGVRETIEKVSFDDVKFVCMMDIVVLIGFVGRHVIAVNEATHPHITRTSHPRAVLKGIGRMFTTYPYWDISYLVAVLFTVGCLIFIACGLLAWLPLVRPSLAKSSSETKILSDWSGWTAFVGATLFQVGAILLVLEAWNEERTGCFGWALRRAVDGRERLEVKPDVRRCRHHHQSRSKEKKNAEKAGGEEKHQWQWYPSWHDLRTHYIHEIGFLASTILALGATVFYVSGILAIPQLYALLSPGVIYGLYYFTYLFGGVLFILSSALYILETQSKWYLPAPQLLGWHVGVWNMIGSVGWTLAAAFGYCAQVKGGEGWCEYESELALTWASIGFTIGSALLWYEAVNKYTVERGGDGEYEVEGEGHRKGGSGS